MKRFGPGLLFLLGCLLVPTAMPGQSNDDCLACHSDKTLAMTKGGHAVALLVDKVKFTGSVHAGLSCTDCHAGFQASELPHAKKIKPVQCQTCHDVGGFEKSVHGRTVTSTDGKTKSDPVANCSDCHGTHQILSPNDPKSAANRGHISATCGQCHDEAVQHFARSAHGMAVQNGVKGAPSCIDCHGEHNVEPVASKESPVSKAREAKMCMSCHLDKPEVRQRMGTSAGFVAGYEASVHGVALASGNEKAATCSDCHGAHDMLKGSNSASRVNKWNIAETCARCHGEVARSYNDSIHGKALQWGNKDAPTCTDCHGEHQIFGPNDPRSRVSATNVSAQVCAACHNSVQLNIKYGIPSERFRTFEDSFHGLASKAGSVAVANCASCHGVHNIKPSSDPTSTISKENLATTCGRCHPGANENFTKGSVHIVLARDGNTAILYWIRTFYIGMIIVVIGGMVLHNAFDFLRKSRHLMAIRWGLIPPEHHGPTQYLRMTLSERLQHATMFSSFIILVITGFMLKFPDAWWVWPIRSLSERFFEVRSITHRVAGIVMIAVSLYHLYHLFFVKRGKQFLRDMLPQIKDVRDAIGLVAYNLGLSKARPMLPRFSYIEKSEYWALVWGVLVMAGTGIVMWFDNYFISLLTKLGWDVARSIHYYEAWLATLAIIAWHFYFVIFSPSAYPMNTAWLTGMLSEEEMAEEHGQELEQIHSAQLRKVEEELKL
jgi:cytochrome b subunit of formate dehydrogenase